MSDHLAARLRSRERVIGYWITTDNPPATERIALAGYDYLCLDTQHGLIDYPAALRGVMAAELGGSAGIVRVETNEPGAINKACDTGARGVLVPLVNSAAEAAAAASACRYPPVGTRSFGPMRSGLRIGPAPREADDQIALIVMIETAEGLDNVREIAATPGVDAIYVGPSDLGLSFGVDAPEDAWPTAEFADALAAIRDAASEAGIGCGLHVFDGEGAASAFADGFTFVSISSDLTHLAKVAGQHLERARA